ncbi:hypothetical protein L1281_000501 [Neisseria sp. HSC-16F19]|nr:DUF2846 domain-containing protein [Neisseria sp. HSC-16F19]MCP2039922.1 hypothetical protein [Neisseria sp. HSC-16F19]
MKKALLYLVTATLLTACGATGTPFSGVTPPSEGQAKIYVFRPKQISGSAVIYQVNAGEYEIGRIRQGGYLEKEVPPGEYDVWAKTELKSSILINLEAGDTKCVRAGLMAGIWIARPFLEYVSLKECEKELIGTKYSE